MEQWYYSDLLGMSMKTMILLPNFPKRSPLWMDLHL